MTLLTTTEKGAVRRTHVWLLLLGGLVLLMIVAALALLSAEDETLEVDTALSNGTALQSGDGSSVAAVGVVEDLLRSEDPVDAGALLACAQFRNGATVVQFAEWFEAEIGTVGPEEEELFRAIVLRALTDSCPEVIPGD
jgi:hypothetical protein